MENPVAALEVLEMATTKAIFKELGVTDDQYNGLLAVVGHATYMKHVAEKGLGGNINLPEVGFTDTGIISRAFNYARGLVSKEYILVEAGFRIMRDNDMNMLDFILNNPEGAELLTEILQKNADPKKVAFQASTFATQMRSYIARQLAFAGNTLIPYEISDENQNEEITEENQIEEKDNENLQ